MGRKKEVIRGCALVSVAAHGRGAKGLGAISLSLAAWMFLIHDRL